MNDSLAVHEHAAWDGVVVPDDGIHQLMDVFLGVEAEPGDAIVQ